MIQCLLDRQSFAWIEHQYFVQEIQCLNWSPREPLLKIWFLLIFERSEILLGILISDEVNILFTRRSNKGEYVIQLIIFAFLFLKLFCTFYWLLLLLFLLFGWWLLVLFTWRERKAFLAWEQRGSCFSFWAVSSDHMQQFSKNAANWPHVDGAVVFSDQKNYFRCTIPSSGDVPS